MTKLAQKILKGIRQNGPITFENFMDVALYDSESGYYASGGNPIGREGDFYTSSHLHPVFGAMIGKQIAGMWEFMGRPEGFRVVEMGAGEGYLCKDMLDYLSRAESEKPETERAFYQNLNYAIIERNSQQRQKQKQRLSIHSEKISWHEELCEEGPFFGCLFSNELLDAFPVHLVQMEEKLKEVYVSEEDDTFVEMLRDISTDEISVYFADCGIVLPNGYRTEVNLRMKKWLKEVGSILKEGFVFTIDYGHPAWDYYSEDRNRGTLLCYHRHQVTENPYDNVGGQDITTHVNFSALKKWGEEAGFRTVGFCQQGVFLVSLGIDEEIRKLAGSSKDYLFELGRIKKLILPGTLGETHKVMIQYKGDGEPKLRGFSMKNQLKIL